MDEQELPLGELGERYGVLRLSHPASEQKLLESLKRYGQTAAVVVCRLPDGSLELLDGFKRLRAARVLGYPTLRVKVIEVTSRAAKAAMLSLNWLSRSTSDLEEGWVVRALVREDGLSQVEVAGLLGRDKSWVCRRLSLVERLSEEVQEQLRLGLVNATIARELARLPRGNQEALLAAVRKHELGSREAAKLVELLNAASTKQQSWILAHPLEALSNREGRPVKRADARLTDAGNRLAEQLSRLESACNAVVTGLGLYRLDQMGDNERQLLTSRVMMAQLCARQASQALALALAAKEDLIGGDMDETRADARGRAAGE